MSERNPTVKVPGTHEEQDFWLTPFQNIQKLAFRGAFHRAPDHLFPNGLCIHTFDWFFSCRVDREEEAVIQIGQCFCEAVEKVSRSGKQMWLEDPDHPLAGTGRSRGCDGAFYFTWVVGVVVNDRQIRCLMPDFKASGDSGKLG